MDTARKQQQWQKSPVSNLVRYIPSGIYFARVRSGGKLIRRSLKTDKLSVARLRLGDFVNELRFSLEDCEGILTGKMTFGDAATIYRQQVEKHTTLKASAKIYRIKTIEALLRSWPALEKTDVSRITKHDCLEWASSFAGTYSPSVFNNTVGSLRHIIDIAISSGARYGNPASAIKKARIKAKILTLPEPNQFTRFVEEMESAGGGRSQRCADLVRFLAYGGFRKGEAALITWADCDLEKGEIVVRGDPKTGTKNWTVRRVPMIPDMVALLQRLRQERTSESKDAPVMHVRECQNAINRAARIVGMKRITHHDLRHLFATRCIESGVDIPTVSRWLGHKDGGALAMKTYGHLRNEHSQAMAQKVKF